MSDQQETSLDTNKVFLRSQANWKIGEKFPVSYAPTVEGMVASTRWIENEFMIVFLSPPFKKPTGTWAEASIMYKSATSFLRKPLSTYDYPFPADPRIVEEVKKASGNLDILQELVKYLNKKNTVPSSSSSSSVEQHKVARPIWDQEALESASADRDNSDRLSLLLSQADQKEQTPPNPLSDRWLETIVEAVSSRLKLSDEPHKKLQSKKKKVTKSTKRDSSSSSSTKSESESSSSSDDEKVGISDSEDGKGWFTCPFNVHDLRTNADPKKKMQGKVEERRFLRKALHDIYSEYNTLKAFVDTVKAESLSSSSRPYNNDLIWLSMHATYLDLLLLHDSEGSWRSWNELVLDALMKSFLELLVRSSTNRAYPEILDERVRKWMKRKRVGLSTQFGAIPTFLAGAKITDSGIQPKGGWEGRNFTRTSTTSSTTSSSSFKNKPQQNHNVGAEKKN